MKKSQPIQFALTFFFGPLGLFYSNMAAAFALIIAAVVLVMVLSPLAGFAVWVASIIMGFGTVDEHNKKVSLKQRRHNELMDRRPVFSHAAVSHPAAQSLSWRG